MNFNLKIKEPASQAVQSENAVEATPNEKAKELLSSIEAGIGINYSITKELSLICVDEVLENWLPGGEQRGRQYVAYNPTRSDESLGSFTINTEDGRWKDFSSDDGGNDLISLISFIEGGISQSDAAVKLLSFIAGIDSSRCKQIKERFTKEKKSQKPKYTPILPIPKHAKMPPKFFGNDLGAPVMSWTYRNETGDVLCIVNRFDTKHGKTYLPLTWCIDDSGWESWRTVAPYAPKPLYGLDRLAERKDAIVLFTEGEKASDAASRLFPEFVTVTTMGGAQAPEKADLTALKGRRVYIARDNDAAGLIYQQNLIKLLKAAGAQVEAVMNLDVLGKDGTALPSGYDLADAESSGWNSEAIRQVGQSLWFQLESNIEISPSTEPIALVPLDPSKIQPNGSKISDQDYAKAFAAMYENNIATINGRIFGYSDGYWQVLNADVDVKRPLLALMGNETTIKKVNAVYELIKVQTAEPTDKLHSNTGLICLTNGTLNPLTKELNEHSPENYLTNRVNIEYQTDAKCPLWNKTLEDIFGRDEDGVEKIQLIQEFLGYCLVPDTKHAKFLWMVGAGGNGKSVILSIFTALLGKPNISYAQIERLERPIVRAELQGKLLNISSEMSANATLSDSYLKQIVAGETVEAERKYEASFSFKPVARLIAATNTLPRLLDHSDGFARRAMILRFNRQFTEAERDIHLESKLMQELSGILNWALVGLSNLESRGRFIIPKSSTSELARYRLNSDPVRLFAEDYLTSTEDRSTWVGSAALYSHYKDWSIANGYRPLSIAPFSDRLENMGFRKVRTSHGKDWSAKYEEKETKLPPLIENSPPIKVENGLGKAFNV